MKITLSTSHNEDISSLSTLITLEAQDQDDPASNSKGSIYVKSMEEPFLGTLTGGSYLTNHNPNIKEENTDKRVLTIDIDLAGSNIKYNPGDSIGILPCN